MSINSGAIVLGTRGRSFLQCAHAVRARVVANALTAPAKICYQPEHQPVDAQKPLNATRDICIDRRPPRWLSTLFDGAIASRQRLPVIHYHNAYDGPSLFFFWYCVSMGIFACTQCAIRTAGFLFLFLNWLLFSLVHWPPPAHYGREGTQ